MPEPEEIRNSHDMFGDIFDDIAEEESAAAKADIKEGTETEEPEEEETESEEEKEEVTPEEEETSEEEEEKEEESEEEDTEEDVEEEEEETEEKEVDKEEKVEYNEADEIHEVTIDGKTSKVSLEELKRDYQKIQAADQRFKEAAQMRKANETFWENLLQNPGEAIVDRVTDEFCEGDRVRARGLVVESLLDWLAPEREAAKIEDEKERQLFERERALDLRQREEERQAEKNSALREQEADEEFDRNLRAELKAALKKHSLPEDQTAIWKRTGKLLQEFSDELPSSMQGDVEAMRAEVVKNAKYVVAQVAKERQETKDALKATLSPDELVEIYPELEDALKKTKIDKVKKKRSKKKKGNAEKQVKKIEKQREEMGSAKKPVSTDKAFAFDDL